MLLFTVLATLLCSSLVDAHLARVNTSAALEQCLNQKECNKAALEINPTTFNPTIKASPLGGVNLNVTVKSNQPLVFPVRAEDYVVTWVITRPGDKCLWEISSSKGTVTFKDHLPSEPGTKDGCIGETGRDVSVTIDVKGKNVVVADVTDGSCKKPIKLGACEYSSPDSKSMPGWDIWTFSINQSESDPNALRANITLKNAYVVYDEPEPTMTTANAFNGTTTSNITTATLNPGASTTPDVGLGAMTWGFIGGCVVFFALFVIAVIIIVILCIRLKRNKGKTSRTKEGPRKEDPKDVTATEDRHCIQTMTENTNLESTSKRMEDEKQVTAAATAQNPAPGEAPGEPKSQASQEVFNKGPAVASNEPAADPTKIA
ncbi:hypothetical protein AAVH_05701 [Aphelenchoides avenae]|nr:hypothetical protein AAVH_05701 [Aphelenchus avenae]